MKPTGETSPIMTCQRCKDIDEVTSKLLIRLNIGWLFIVATVFWMGTLK